MSIVATGLLVSGSPTKSIRASALDDVANDEGVIVDLEEKPNKLTLASIVLANGNDIKYTRLQELYHERFGHDLSCRRLCAALGISDHIRNPILALRLGGSGLFEIRLLSVDFTIHVSDKALASDVCSFNATMLNSASSTVTITTTTTDAQLSPSIFEGINLFNSSQIEPSDNIVIVNEPRLEPKVDETIPSAAKLLTTVEETMEPTSTTIVEPSVVGTDGIHSSSSSQSFSLVSTCENVGGEATAGQVNPSSAETVSNKIADGAVGPKRLTDDYQSSSSSSLFSAKQKSKGVAQPKAVAKDSCCSGDAFAIVTTSSSLADIDRLRLRVISDSAYNNKNDKAVFNCCKSTQREHVKIANDEKPTKKII